MRCANAILKKAATRTAIRQSDKYQVATAAPGAYD
jgi:hypothetical protein